MTSMASNTRRYDLNVILIDGHDDDRRFLAQRLKIAAPDYYVFEAETGTAGLAVFRSQRIDCVVTELTLPDMSGFEVLVNLVARAFRPEVPVILMSDTAVPSMPRLAINNGAQAYLDKSRLCGDELDMVIQRAVAHISSRHHDLNEFHRRIKQESVSSSQHSPSRLLSGSPAKT